MLAKFGKWLVRHNEDVCNRVESALPSRFTRSLLHAHELRAAAEIVSRTPPTRVLDIGGGRNSPFIDFLPARELCTVIALDILQTQIGANKSADLKIVGDVCGAVPLRDGSVEVVVTRSVLEHLRDPRAAVREIHRVLTARGVCIHVFPARFSPFPVLNRIIPDKIAHRLLFAFFPEWSGHCGFPAFYRYCDAPAMAKIHTEAGLVVRSVECRHYQSIYFKFFVPLYLLSLGYDLMMYWLNWPLLACQILLAAEKHASGL
ncbi:MAG: class I SAM-dependent methyltransferase [Stellaceae bacterium]